MRESRPPKPPSAGGRFANRRVYGSWPFNATSCRRGAGIGPRARPTTRPPSSRDLACSSCRVWNPDDPTPTIVFADKHGGRNRYGSLLDGCLDGQMVWCQGESRDESIYRVGQTEIRFEPRSERHFPVALASMVSKYVRELAMELFNRFWRFHLPESSRRAAIRSTPAAFAKKSPKCRPGWRSPTRCSGASADDHRCAIRARHIGCKPCTAGADSRGFRVCRSSPSIANRRVWVALAACRQCLCPHTSIDTGGRAARATDHSRRVNRQTSVAF